MEPGSSESLNALWIELCFSFQLQDPVDVVENKINKNPMVLECRSPFDFNKTLLHLAVESQNAAENLDVIELLVQRGEKALKMKNREFNFPLHTACSNKHSSVEVIQLLVNSFPDSVRLHGFLERTPLHMAVLDELEFNIIKFLFDLYPEAAVERNGCGISPLDIACNTDTPRQEVIELLLSRNSECIHVLDIDGFTPLSCLCSRTSRNISRDTIQIVYDACPKAARKKVGKGSDVHLNAFHLACDSLNLTAVNFLCDIDPCLFITVHDESSTSWDTFYDSLKKSFEIINNNPQVYECVRHAAVSLVRKLVPCKHKRLSHMEAEVAEHLVELMERRPIPTLQEVNKLDVKDNTLAEGEIFQELQNMLSSKRFQTFLKACPILLQARRDPENKAKAVVALASSVCRNNPDLLFHQLHKNPFIIEKLVMNNNQKKRKQCAR